MARFSLSKNKPSLRTPKGAVSQGTDKSGLEVFTKDGRPCKWEWKVGKKGERGSGYRNAKVPKGMDKGHVMSVQEGAKDTALADSPLNIVPQTPKVNRSNINRFEAWRAENCKGHAVTCVQPQADGLMRVQVTHPNGTVKVDTTFDPNSHNRWDGNWWEKPGPHS